MHRILIIGAGDIGQRHLRCFRATGRAEVGICEVDERLRAEVANREAVEWAFGELGEALGMHWDAAVIAVPTHLHMPIALKLTETGTPILIEKPLSVTEQGVAELIQAVAERGLFAAVGYTFRAHPALAGLRDLVRSGGLGAPLQVVAVRGANQPHRRPNYRNIYYADRARGGGAIQDILPHMVNAGEWVAGPITRLAADAEHLALPGVEVEDTVHMLARHGAVMGCYCLNQHQAPGENTLTVNCERGTARVEFHRNRLLTMDRPDGEWFEQAYPLSSQETLFTLQAHAFLDGVEGRAAPLCSLAEARGTLRTILAALGSVEDGGAWRAPEGGGQG